jgi:hypothetical protein
VAAVNAAIQKAEKSRAPGKELARLNVTAAGLDKEADGAKTPAAAERLRALAGILKQGGTSVH